MNKKLQSVDTLFVEWQTIRKKLIFCILNKTKQVQQQKVSNFSNSISLAWKFIIQFKNQLMNIVTFFTTLTISFPQRGAESLIPNAIFLQIHS
jgi:hypothetical protein